MDVINVTSADSKKILLETIDKMQDLEIRRDYLLTLKEAIIQEEKLKEIETFNTKEVFERFQNPRTIVGVEDLNKEIKNLKEEITK